MSEQFALIVSTPEILDAFSEDQIKDIMEKCSTDVLHTLNEINSSPLHILCNFYGACQCSETRQKCFVMIYFLLKHYDKKELYKTNIKGDTFMHCYTHNVDVYTISYNFLGIVSILVGKSIFNVKNTNNETPMWNLINKLASTPPDTHHTKIFETTVSTLTPIMSYNKFIHINRLRTLIAYDYHQLVYVLLCNAEINRDFNEYLNNMNRTAAIDFVAGMSRNMVYTIFNFVDTSSKTYSYQRYNFYVIKNSPLALYGAIRDNDVNYVKHIFKYDCIDMINNTLDGQTIFQLEMSHTIQELLYDKCKTYLERGVELSPLAMSWVEDFATLKAAVELAHNELNQLNHDIVMEDYAF